MSKKVTRFQYKNLRNEAHVQFHDTFVGLVNKFNSSILDIKPQFDAYLLLLATEKSALDVVRKSALTEAIDEQDTMRDSIFRGFDNAVRSALNHFDPSKREAAKTIRVALDKYGNIAAKPLDQETAVLRDMIAQLRTPACAPAVEQLMLSEWLERLEAENEHFDWLMMQCCEETAAQSHVNMRAARTAVDHDLREILDRLEALALVSPNDIHEPFFNELNAVMEHYRNLAGHEHYPKKES
jgi:hypothetical protein